MNVQPLGSRSPSIITQPSQWISSASGILSRKDIEVISAATGVDFTWPPQDGARVPEAAFMIANEHQRQMIAGSPLHELTANDIRDLGRRGIVDADFVAKAVAYLAKNDTARPTSGSAVEKPTRPTSGSVAPDGSVYL